MSRLHSISKPDGARADIIFVHGLGGDPFSTWQHDRRQPKDSWLFWLKKRVPDVAVHTLEYQASPTHWLGEAMPLQDRAVEVLAELDLCGIGKRPVMFVGHSLGGLVIKQLLRIANDEHEGTAANSIIAQTRLVAFFATPHMGADAATWGSHLGKVLRASPALTSLRAHDAHLRALDHWYRSQHERWTTLAFIETRPTNVSSFIPLSWIRRVFARLPTRILVVAQGDANPNIPDVRAVPMEDDHISITKPTDPESKKCLLVERAIQSELSSQSKDPVPSPSTEGSEELAAISSDQIEASARLHALPAKNPDFVGREDDMERIRTALAKGGAVITAIEGMGGIGKTAVGVEVANRLQDEGMFSGGVPFVDLEGFSATREPLSTKEALEALLRPIIGRETKLPDDDQNLRQLWKQATADRRMLLFLDNARDEAQIRPLLPGHPGCKVLATSRNRLDLDGIEPIKLDVMAPDKAAVLAHTLGNRWQQGRVSPEQAMELARLCGYLPLPIKVTAVALGKAPLLDVDTQLMKLSAVGRDALGMEEVKAILSQSLDQLTPELRTAWQKLGVFEGDFSAAAAAAVIDDEDAHDTLAELEQRHLLTLSAEQRLQLHDILRALALESLPTDERDAAEDHHATFYKDLLANAKELYKEGKVLDGLRLYDQEQHQIRAGQRWAATNQGATEEVVRLAADYANAGAYILQLRLPPRQQIEWLEAQLGACRTLDDRQGEGNALGNLGNAYNDLGENKRAIEFLEQQLEIAREINDRRGEGNALGSLGNAYGNLGETKRAIDVLEQRLKIAREIGDRRGEGNALGNLGNAYNDLGESKRAIEFYEQQQEIAREIGDRRGESRAWYNGALAFDDLGDRATAITWLKNALAIEEALEDPTVDQTRQKLAEWTDQTAAE